MRRPDPSASPPAIELKKGAVAAEMLVVVEEIAAVLRAELSAGNQAAA